jgi:hypothetical protein
MKSKLFWLEAKDFIKGAIVAVLTGIGTILTTEISGGGEHLLRKVGLSALVAFIAYLTKNILTDHNDKFVGMV